MSKFSSFGKAWFVCSVALLAFLYGYAVHSWGLFPRTYLERAAQQAKKLYYGESRKLTIPRVYDRQGVRLKAPDAMQPGMTLITSIWTEGSSDRLRPGAKLIDRRGRTVHEWHPDRHELFSEAVQGRRTDLDEVDFDGSYLFPNGDLLLILEYTGAVRVDACGRLKWKIEEGAHHYLSRAEDGSFWIPGTSAERRTKTAKHPDGFPGIEKPVWLDRILHVSADGEILSKTNVLDLLYQSNLERHIVKGYGPYAKKVHDDPVHLNEIEPLGSSMAEEYPLFEAGDLLLSLRHPSLVLVVDPESGDVKWHASHPFLHQHDPDFLGGGWIGVFDNNDDFTDRGRMLGGSRIVALQPHTDSVEVRFPTQYSDPFYTNVQGQWQPLANGNLLLVESRAGRVVEVGPRGPTVWEWVHEPYNETRVPIVTGAKRYGVTQEQVASWPCSSVDSLRRSTQNNGPAP